jgi:hypothetical protein
MLYIAVRTETLRDGAVAKGGDPYICVVELGNHEFDNRALWARSQRKNCSRGDYVNFKNCVVGYFFRYISIRYRHTRHKVRDVYLVSKHICTTMNMQSDDE